ncbi:MAG: hypothetical protein GY882_01700 [Actinomycetia bacterium]|nr:hypothetical protein [Actinomycetes bacterium]
MPRGTRWPEAPAVQDPFLLEAGTTSVPTTHAAAGPPVGDLRLPAEVPVAGISHYQDVAATIRVGDRMRITAEPTNAYDPNALRIETMDGRLVGYVPAKLAARLTGRDVVGAVSKVFDAKATTGLRVVVSDSIASLLAS